MDAFHSEASLKDDVQTIGILSCVKIIIVFKSFVLTVTAIIKMCKILLL